MNSDAQAIGLVTRRNRRVSLAVTGAILVGVYVSYAATLRASGALTASGFLAYTLLALLLFADYVWVFARLDRPQTLSLWQTSLPIAVEGVLLAGMVYLLQRNAAPYFFLLALNAYSTFWYYKRPRAALPILTILVLARLIYPAFERWQAPGGSTWTAISWYWMLVIGLEAGRRHWALSERAEAQTRQLERAIRQLRHSLAQSRQLAVMQERARLAHAIHDTLGHTLTSLDVQLALLEHLPSEQRAERQQAIMRARHLTRSGLTDLRRAVQALKPAALEAVSLPEAIRSLTDGFNHRSQVAATFQLSGEPYRLPAEHTLVLYHAAQEGLTNIQRHAFSAQQVAVRLHYGACDVSVRLDNTAPPAPAAAPPAAPLPGNGTGLRSLARRAGELGGGVSAGHTPHGGFCLELRLPHPAPDST